MDSNQSRERLRAVIAAGDSKTLVRLLTGQAWPTDSLQLIGDGLIDATAAGVDGAAEQARRCAAALRERGGDGDDLLADTLQAGIGDRPQPVLLPVPVDMDQLAAALETSQWDNPGRLNLATGEVWPPLDPDYADTDDDEDDEDEEDGCWLPIHGQGSRAGYRDMELFIADLDDPAIADRLNSAIHGQRAFRRFKDTLSSRPALLKAWYAFSQDRQVGRARAWLAEEGYLRASPDTTRHTRLAPPEP